MMPSGPMPIYGPQATPAVAPAIAPSLNTDPSAGMGIAGGAPGDSIADTGPPGTATGLGDLASQFGQALVGMPNEHNPRGFSIAPSFAGMAMNAYKDASFDSNAGMPSAAQSAAMEAQDRERAGDSGMGGMGTAADGGSMEGGSGPGGDIGGEGHDGAYFRGGVVDKAALPGNPPGPDDVYISAKRGEVVIPRHKVAALMHALKRR